MRKDIVYADMSDRLILSSDRLATVIIDIPKSVYYDRYFANIPLPNRP